ncbi:hypothetical protein SAMN05443432_101469 [Roseovarius litoreus]|uniref:Uncharacterized protein n=1 Tax=Roseovarius litoreus TaxID=1155722 RepID=A0A1M7AIP3_9RHOB|nr:hypothetical protein [Roseovarius litoreus]SHL42640.1 hypothetical protein SAMN05443432_101469 [Roseovarius litoreus]
MTPNLPRRSSTALAIALAVASTAVCAQDLEYLGEVEGWDVMVDPSLGYGCLIQAEYNDGSVVRIGFDRNEGAGYVTAFNDAWGDIEEGEVYPILFDLDGAEYEGEATGIYLAGVPGADIYFDNPEFLWDIAAKYTMTLYNAYGEVMAIDLSGTMVGLEAVIECQKELG